MMRAVGRPSEMFALDGRHSDKAIAAQAVIDHCGLNLEARRDDSVAITAYRRDQVDGYFYITAFAGLRESEPMFGPLRRQTDYRIREDGPSISDPYGFREREGVVWTHPIRQRSWHLYISGREKVPHSITKEPAVTNFTKRLEAILSSPRSSIPLFPELWFQERLTRDDLRDVIHDCVPGTSLEEIAAKITANLCQAFARLVGGSDVSMGIYLDTGKDWLLCGATPTNPGMRERVEKLDNNAFT